MWKRNRVRVTRTRWPELSLQEHEFPWTIANFIFFWFFTIIPVTCTVFRCQRRHSLSFSVGQIERLRHNKRDVLRTTHANWLFCPIYGEQNHLNCMRFAKCWVSRTDHSVCTRSIDNGCWHPNDRKHCFALIIIVIGECRKMLYTTMGTNQRYTAAYDTSTPPPHAHTLRIHSKWAIKNGSHITFAAYTGTSAHDVHICVYTLLINMQRNLLYR